MKENYTHVIMLIDRSGSMESCKQTMEKGILKFLEAQRKEEGTCTVTAARFNYEYQLLYEHQDIQSIGPVTIEPKGMTALYDSMYRLIEDAGKALNQLPENEKPSNVLYLTITDGIENASTDINGPQLAKLVRQQEEQYNWNFTYIGANHDSFLTANNLGMRVNTSLNYRTNEAGIDEMFNKLSNATSRYRKGENKKFGYTKEEQESE